MKKAFFPIANFYLYTILLIITPFLMLQNYLQEAIGAASRATIDLGGVHIPYLIIIASIGLVLFFYFSRKTMTKKRLLILGIIIVFFAAGQMTADYYFGHRFYDLQQNWHYFAYGIFSVIAFMRFSIKPAPVNTILIKIFLMALAISVFDEAIQVYISNRVFDLSDCGKDLWGSLAGSIFVFFYMEDAKGFTNYRFRNNKLKEYYTNPFSLLCLEIIFAYIFLFIASQITDEKYKFSVIIMTLIIFIIAFLLILAGINRVVRWIIRSSLLLIIIMVVIASRFGNSGAKYISPGYLKYNGIPLVYFDFMIFPDGSFRTVDKKESFTLRDKNKISNLDPDILIIGKGSKGQGGKGWHDNKTTEMYYNTFNHKIYQIIKLPNAQACITFNRLKKLNKKVLFIIHNE